MFENILLDRNIYVWDDLKEVMKLMKLFKKISN